MVRFILFTTLTILLAELAWAQFDSLAAEPAVRINTVCSTTGLMCNPDAVPNCAFCGGAVLDFEDVSEFSNCQSRPVNQATGICGLCEFRPGAIRPFRAFDFDSTCAVEVSTVAFAQVSQAALDLMQGLTLAQCQDFSAGNILSVTILEEVSRIFCIAPSPTPTASTSISPSVSPSPSVTPSISPSVSSSPSVTPSISPSVSPLVSPSPSITPSISPSVSSSPSVTPSISPSVSPSVSPSPSASLSISPSMSTSPSVTASVSVSLPSTIPSISLSPSPFTAPSISGSSTVSPTLSVDVTPSASLSSTPSATPSATISSSPSASPLPSISSTPSVSSRPSISPTQSGSPTTFPSRSPKTGNPHNPHTPQEPPRAPHKPSKLRILCRRPRKGNSHFPRGRHRGVQCHYCPQSRRGRHVCCEALCRKDGGSQRQRSRFDRPTDHELIGRGSVRFKSGRYGSDQLHLQHCVRKCNCGQAF